MGRPVTCGRYYKHMFKKVLIANRGAIATRIIRTLSEMGIQSVAVYNEADSESLHVAHADEAYSLGEGRVADTYLNQDKIFSIIKECGAEAIHPGYGFLSENPEFVLRCEIEGICFIGPTADQMRAFGLKHSARELAEQNNMPLLPGSGLIDDVTQAIMSAKKIGYPLMLKSTAGGGGIGMQLCWNQKELSDAFDSVRRLSENNFSNSGVFLEKFVEHARHIEVQILGDGRGNAIALGERDCSTQRRNQKVIEETPAPNIPENIRTELQQKAIDLVAAIQYRNAGTVEYIYDQETEQFYFLEVNTRLQVEHGVTEEVFGIDLVKWMIELAAGELQKLPSNLEQNGHAIQVRLYAEDPNKDFQPSSGLLNQVEFPVIDGLRIDSWISSGVEISSYFDPMLAKVVVKAATRELAISKLHTVLDDIKIYGVETNNQYVQQILETAVFNEGRIFTRFLNEFDYLPNTLDVIDGGTMTTIQDYPGRVGYWDVGVPPSGPFDNLSFQYANRILENDPTAAGLEITLNGPTLKFNSATQIVLTGATMTAHLDNQRIPFWQVIDIEPGQVLTIKKVDETGARAYLAINDGFICPDYLQSKSTFTLGQFGGHAGRAIRTGDVLKIPLSKRQLKSKPFPAELVPNITSKWELHVMYGPHGAPDFFTDNDIETFFAVLWEVHYNSSRTGVRLVGPKPQWARTDGGEAGMHPSNIHDNAYAIGSVDFTGDMPVILGPDGPSLGGFVCPVTVISADLWKLGQLKAGDKIQFIAVEIDEAIKLEINQNKMISSLSYSELQITSCSISSMIKNTPILKTIIEDEYGPKIVYRPAGDKYLLIEYGPLVLDIELRFRVHAMYLLVKERNIQGIIELTPGIRSLQIHYDNHELPLEELLETLAELEKNVDTNTELSVSARTVYLPLSWNDKACHEAIDKYMQSVRKDAPWCPDNIEFIRRINGLASVKEVKEIVFKAKYLVMGLGDVYLGAPVATPIDPRHRLVTTKYNPARTWTAENSVGIGGSYMCVYGMEGPGGYQFIGRTLQMWNRYKSTSEFSKPWLLRFFDQIKFYEVSADELRVIRKDFPNGRYPLKIEEIKFSLSEYKESLLKNSESIERFTEQRQKAFAQELQHWISSGQINFDSEQDLDAELLDEEFLPENAIVIQSTVAGSVWEVLVKKGDHVKVGQPLIILESMKMEITVNSTHNGTVYDISRKKGSQVGAGQGLLIITED